MCSCVCLLCVIQTLRLIDARVLYGGKNPSLSSKICKFGIYDEATLRLHLAFEGRHGNLKGGWIKNKKVDIKK